MISVLNWGWVEPSPPTVNPPGPSPDSVSQVGSGSPSSPNGPHLGIVEPQLITYAQT
jgi:hypothetical protein